MSERLPIDSLSLAQAVQAAVEAMPDVAHVSSGRYARIGTYGPSTIVRGVAVSQLHDEVKFDIHIIASSNAQSLAHLADTVRHVTRETALTHGAASVGQIDVTIEDLRDEEPPQ